MYEPMCYICMAVGAVCNFGGRGTRGVAVPGLVSRCAFLEVDMVCNNYLQYIKKLIQEFWYYKLDTGWRRLQYIDQHILIQVAHIQMGCRNAQHHTTEFVWLCVAFSGLHGSYLAHISQVNLNTWTELTNPHEWVLDGISNVHRGLHRDYIH